MHVLVLSCQIVAFVVLLLGLYLRVAKNDVYVLDSYRSIDIWV